MLSELSEGKEEWVKGKKWGRRNKCEWRKDRTEKIFTTSSLREVVCLQNAPNPFYISAWYGLSLHFAYLVNRTVMLLIKTNATFINLWLKSVSYTSNFLQMIRVIGKRSSWGSLRVLCVVFWSEYPQAAAIATPAISAADGGKAAAPAAAAAHFPATQWSASWHWLLRGSPYPLRELHPQQSQRHPTSIQPFQCVPVWDGTFC